jgi:hypothetical protein
LTNAIRQEEVIEDIMVEKKTQTEITCGLYEIASIENPKVTVNYQRV